MIVDGLVGAESGEKVNKLYICGILKMIATLYNL